MTERSVKCRSFLTEGDTLFVVVDGTVIAIDLINGASPEAKAALTEAGLNLEELLAAEWARD